MHKFLKFGADILRDIVYLISGIQSRNDKILVFGSWWGDKVADNAYYYLNELLTKEYSKDLLFVWIGKEAVRKDVIEKFHGKVKFSRINSLDSFRYISKAKYGFTCNGNADLGRFIPNKNMKVVQLWHGFPFKKIGADMPGFSNEGRSMVSFASYFLSTSEVMTKRLKSAFRNYGITEDNIIKAGQPRNMGLYYSQNVKKELNIPSDKKIITYLPTFRDNVENTFSFNDLSGEDKIKLMKKNIVIIEKPHHFKFNEAYPDNILVKQAPDRIDTQKLLAVTDVLVTDFSSVYADFLYLNRPIIHFLYDGDFYQNCDRGLYCNSFSDESGGAIIYSNEELIKSIISSLSGENDIWEQKRKTLHHVINYYPLENSVDVISKKIGLSE